MTPEQVFAAAIKEAERLVELQQMLNSIKQSPHEALELILNLYNQIAILQRKLKDNDIS